MQLGYLDGIVQDGSIANDTALEILKPRTKQSICNIMFSILWFKSILILVENYGCTGRCRLNKIGCIT